MERKPSRLMLLRREVQQRLALEREAALTRWKEERGILQQERARVHQQHQQHQHRGGGGGGRVRPAVPRGRVKPRNGQPVRDFFEERRKTMSASASAAAPSGGGGGGYHGSSGSGAGRVRSGQQEQRSVSAVRSLPPLKDQDPGARSPALRRGRGHAAGGHRAASGGSVGRRELVSVEETAGFGRQGSSSAPSAASARRGAPVRSRPTLVLRADDEDEGPVVLQSREGTHVYASHEAKPEPVLDLVHQRRREIIRTRSTQKPQGLAPSPDSGYEDVPAASPGGVEGKSRPHLRPSKPQSPRPPRAPRVGQSPRVRRTKPRTPTPEPPQPEESEPPPEEEPEPEVDAEAVAAAQEAAAEKKRRKLEAIKKRKREVEARKKREAERREKIKQRERAREEARLQKQREQQLREEEEAAMREATASGHSAAAAHPPPAARAASPPIPTLSSGPAPSDELAAPNPAASLDEQPLPTARARRPPRAQVAEEEEEVIAVPQAQYQLPPGAGMPPEAAPPGNLVPCSICGRKFNPDRLAKHEKVCAITKKKKRKAFDGKKQRVQGTDSAEFQAVAKKNEKFYEKKAKKGDWRRKHENFIAAIRAAKGDGPPPPSEPDPSLVQCPSCGRRFNETAAARHIPKCKERAKKAPPKRKGR